ncbi:hypothetical protein JX266_000442 [Neoarthrinium moseri]|nr:hypothetical protein JX266_000442 [Neoarthrinium moseri]
MADAASARTLNGASSRVRRNQNQGQGQGQTGGVSRNSSTRSSAVYNDDYMQPQGYGNHGLRSTASRFSLNDQFAATAKEFEFGFDDGASTFDRMTIASEAVGAYDEANAAVAGPMVGGLDPSALQGRGRVHDYYDLLVLPLDASAQDIRKAYYRLFVLLYPESHPPKLRTAARAYFTLVQTAFETLIDPDPRLLHDLSNGRDVALEHSAQLDPLCLWHVEALRYLIDDLVANENGSLELGIRLDAVNTKLPTRPGLKGSMLQPLDFALTQSISTSLPGLGNSIDAIVTKTAGLFRLGSPGSHLTQLEIDGKHLQSRVLASRRTLLTVRGFIAGFLQDLVSLPEPVVADPYRPNIPTHIPRERALQLLDGKLHPLVAVKLQHQLPPRLVSGSDGFKRPRDGYEAGALLELEAGTLPKPSISVGITKQVNLPKDDTTSVCQLATSVSPWHRGIPTVSATLQRPLSQGFIQCKMDSGDWVFDPDETCRAFTRFSRMSKRLLNLDFPTRIAPRVELDYTCGSSRSLASCIPDRSRDRGLVSLDRSMGRDRIHSLGSWTVSTAAEPHYLGGSLRYSVDSSILSVVSNAIRKNSSIKSALKEPRGVRFEAELSSSSIWARFIALRCLKQVGQFSKFGFEVGFSTYNLYLSLYWSRLGQRIRVPFLISSGPSVSPRILFWTTLVPFASFAVWDYIAHRRRLNAIDRKERDQLHLLQEKRTEADDLTILMSANVEGKQEVERANRGLVILSAKYGIKTGESWGLEEVADVTTAVGALVDNSQLHIPSNVNKNNILGFWDPVPGSAKTLHVRYLYQGKESTVEVVGQQALSLPPM